ncbi:MAG TPA: hypothetical protein VFV89_13330 [Nocardioides sp.]|uniref:hypothetical protein n=1 Tax=Nocardioides sp. TaxID=35761 RepID=UPI002E34A9E2|nr:hypothetical protein [Nocardioides sp.]HEX5088786.1 hypothetical protein [Nocardioides sp.]
MTITTIGSIRTRSLGRASLAVAAASLLALTAACGSEHASQAPASIGKAATSSPWAEPPGDSSERLLDQRKTLQPGDSGEPQYLAPSGRDVPLPGQNG